LERKVTPPIPEVNWANYWRVQRGHLQLTSPQRVEFERRCDDEFRTLLDKLNAPV
jgi:hypothetical protein